METDPHSRRIAGLHRVTDLENRLKQILVQKQTYLDPDCQFIREQLQRAYENALMNDWNDDSDFETQLWKPCFYKVIDEYRQKLRSFNKIADEAQSKNDQKRVQASRKKRERCSIDFHAFLQSATGFYHNFLAKLRSKYSLSLDRPVPSTLDPKCSEYRHLLLCFRILIRLGDLARYQRELSGFEDADWQSAWVYYMDAQRLMPSQGMPFNQLAVLCFLSQDSIASLYYHARSLALSVPNDTSKGNFDVMMKGASFSKYLHERQKYIDSIQAPKRARPIGGSSSSNASHTSSSNYDASDLWNIFVSGFIGLHKFDENAETVELVAVDYFCLLNDFDHLVSSNIILDRPTIMPRPNGTGASPLTQIFTYNIFSIWSTLKRLANDELSSTQRHLLASVLNITQQVSINMLSTIMKRAADHLYVWNRVFQYVAPRAQQPPEHIEQADINIGKLELLPAISIFLDWLHSRAVNVLAFDLSNSQERANFFSFREALSLLLEQVLPHANKLNSIPISRSADGLPPLPEELELSHFLPLNAAFEDIDFNLLSILHESQEAFIRRCYKVVKFAYRALVEPNLIGIIATNNRAESAFETNTNLFSQSMASLIKQVVNPCTSSTNHQQASHQQASHQQAASHEASQESDFEQGEKLSLSHLGGAMSIDTPGHSSSASSISADETHFHNIVANQASQNNESAWQDSSHIHSPFPASSSSKERDLAPRILFQESFDSINKQHDFESNSVNTGSQPVVSVPFPPAAANQTSDNNISRNFAPYNIWGSSFIQTSPSGPSFSSLESSLNGSQVFHPFMTNPSSDLHHMIPQEQQPLSSSLGGLALANLLEPQPTIYGSSVIGNKK